jgi:hypothetical protein
MQVRLKADGRVLQGTAVQIVTTMQGLAFGQDHLSLPDYIDWAVAQLTRLEGTELKIEGATPEERARSFVSEMLRAGLAEKL